ncbi:hypothetical protein QI059_01095 [Staphylococcus saprophyticus]|nr:hypothetical protein [Staphylococcus saprophyticus]
MILASMRYKSKKVQSGDLRTPVIFYQYKNEGPYPDDVEEVEVHRCYAETYNPSMKDRQILGVNESMQGLSMVIRDAYQSFTPNNRHIVFVEDFRLENPLFNVHEVRLDTPERGFITLVLGEK